MSSMLKISHLRRALLPSNESPSGAGAGRDVRQNVKWVDGVRGVASFFVLTTHLCRSWDYSLWSPRDTEMGPPQLLQLPFLRLPWQGRIGVTMFAFLTGYVCAIKPLRQAKSGDKSAALTTLAKSAFRRPPRLILPSTIAIMFAWVFAQLGGFEVAIRCDSEWLRNSSVKNVNGLSSEIPRLFRELHKNWVENHNTYDDHQWALNPLLLGAFTVYLTLAATIYMKNKWRTIVLASLTLWYWFDYTPFVETFSMQFIYGVLLCDIGSEPKFREFVNRWGKTRRVVQTLLMVIGIYVAGYPGEHADWAGWSRQLHWIGQAFFPKGRDLGRRWTAIGWDLAVTGIWLSPTLQTMFSNKTFMWLGRNSFAVYLTHGTMLRCFAVRLIYGWSGQGYSVTKNDKGEEIHHWIPRGGRTAFMFGIPIFLIVEYTLAHFWTTYVDSFCAKVTKYMEDMMFESKDEKMPMQYA